MKAREQRTKVILPARVRWEGRWVSATVRNMSSGGLMIAASVPPPPGTYVEVQIAEQTIAARAMWTQQQFCGLRAQGKLDVARLCGTPGPRAAATPDRRGTPREDRADRSRQFASLFQYCVALVFAVGAAGSLGWEVFNIISAPLTAIGHKLSSGE